MTLQRDVREILQKDSSVPKSVAHACAALAEEVHSLKQFCSQLAQFQTEVVEMLSNVLDKGTYMQQKIDEVAKLLERTDRMPVTAEEVTEDGKNNS